MQLERRWPLGQHARAAVVGVAHQIDQQVDLVGPDPIGQLLVGVASHHAEVLHALLHRAGVGIGNIVDGIGEHLKAFAVVVAKQAMDQGAHGVVAEIGGEVADPQPP